MNNTESSDDIEVYMEHINLNKEIIIAFFSLTGTFCTACLSLCGIIISKNFKAGSETSEVKLFNIREIPWVDIAFPSVKFFLEKYAKDYKNNKNFKYHSNFAGNNSK